MRITNLQVKSFRCFSDIDITFEKPIVLISGINGAGKTSLIEALHYLCYLRSFRTYITQEMVQFGKDSFFIKALFTLTENDDDVSHELQVGFSHKKRLVKINKKPVQSYKQLMDYYRIITLCEDDLGLIKGSPEARRTFLDQAILLSDPSYALLLKKLKQIIYQRNSLLKSMRFDYDSYLLWTEQLWHQSRIIQEKRIVQLRLFQTEIDLLLTRYFDKEVAVTFEYQCKKIMTNQSLEQFLAKNQQLHQKEVLLKRSLFGAHLDDFTINFGGKVSKLYASRGQQKLIIVLIKMAQLQSLHTQKGGAIFLLDDFMTDFDLKRVDILLEILEKSCSQIIFTSPSKKGPLDRKLKQLGAQQVILSN